MQLKIPAARAFLARWWSPPVTHILFYALFLLALPVLTLDLCNSRSLVLLEILLGGLAGPLALAILHRSSWMAALAIELAAVSAVFFTWPTEQMGNWKMQVAGHLLGWSFAAFAGCALVQSAALACSRKK